MNQSEDDEGFHPCNPVWEFDHIVAQIAASLPQVDAFRLRRVCRRFDRMLRPRLESVVLHCYGLRLQFLERGLARLDFEEVADQILGVYGERMIALEITFSGFSHPREIVEKIISRCPNLEELHLKSYIYFDSTPWFPAGGLLQMPNLKILDAKLRFQRGDDDAGPDKEILKRFTELEKLSEIDMEKLSEIDMEKLSEIDLKFECEMVRKSGSMLESVKALSFTPANPPPFQCFSRVQEWVVHCYNDSRFPVEFVPEGLTKLYITYHTSFSFSAEDADLLKLLLNITYFIIYYFDREPKDRCFPNFNFLSSFSKLASISVANTSNFTADAFLLIPVEAPLTKVELIYCPANCTKVYRSLIRRKCRLVSIQLQKKFHERQRAVVLELVEFNQGFLEWLHVTWVDDPFLERLPSAFLANPAFLYLRLNDRITAEGVRGLLRRRKQLLLAGTSPKAGRYLLSGSTKRRQRNGDSGDAASWKCMSIAGRCGLLVIVLAVELAEEVRSDSQMLLVESMTHLEGL